MQLALSIFGLLGGPLLGVITLGMFFKKANWVVSFNFEFYKNFFFFFINKGALTGLIISTIANIWLGFEGVIYSRPIGLKPLTTIGCNSSIFPVTQLPLSSTRPPDEQDS